MLVFLALGNAKVLSFALGDAKVPNASSFASQWNIGLKVTQTPFSEILYPPLYTTWSKAVQVGTCSILEIYMKIHYVCMYVDNKV